MTKVLRLGQLFEETRPERFPSNSLETRIDVLTELGLPEASYSNSLSFPNVTEEMRDRVVTALMSPSSSLPSIPSSDIFRFVSAFSVARVIFLFISRSEPSSGLVLPGLRTGTDSTTGSSSLITGILGIFRCREGTGKVINGFIGKRN